MTSMPASSMRRSRRSLSKGMVSERLAGVSMMKLPRASCYSQYNVIRHRKAARLPRRLRKPGQAGMLLGAFQNKKIEEETHALDRPFHLRHRVACGGSRVRAG